MVLIGTSSGHLYFYNVETKQLSLHRLSRQTLTKTDSPISSIDFCSSKPWRVLLTYYNHAVFVYSMNKHESVLSIRDKPFAAAVYQESNILAFLTTGYYEIYKDTKLLQSVKFTDPYSLISINLPYVLVNKQSLFQDFKMIHQSEFTLSDSGIIFDSTFNKYY